MQCHINNIKFVALVIAFAASLFGSTAVHSSNVGFVGTASYSYAGNFATLTADRVENFDPYGLSGTLHLELWAFLTPYDGSAQVGYKLATYSLGQLSAGYYYSNIYSGAVPFALPPNGSWAMAMILTEYDAGPTDGGYSIRDYTNFPLRLLVGPQASDISFVGSVGYSFVGNGIVLTADRVENDSLSGLSGTVRVELWAFPTPYVGTGLAGHRLAAYSLGTLFAGYGIPNVNSGVTSFSSPPNGSWFVTMVVTEYDGNPFDDGYTPRDYVNFQAPLVIGPPTASTTIAVEYHHASFDHYFITPVAAEIALLDAHAPPFQDWSRTGFSFKVYVPATAPAGTVPTCRFFNATFAPKSSHFYAPHGFGCEATISLFPDWTLEAAALFSTMLPDSGGTCPAGSIPVYRLYNNGQGGAPNHRFVTNLSERQKMLNKGYVPEGSGIGVGMCAPP